MSCLYFQFKRKFSMSTYKNMRIGLGEMTFFKDFVNDKRGDLYPVLEKSEDLEESVDRNLYKIDKGMVKRLFCQFFPFASYETSFDLTDGEVGFSFKLPNTEAAVTVNGNKIIYSCDDHLETIDVPEGLENAHTLVVSCRPRAFDIYFKINGKAEYITTFYDEKFADSNRYALFSSSHVCLVASGKLVVKEVLSYVDNGISLADIRPIKYENGDVIYEQGRIWFSASVRMQEGAFQGVFSWIPGSSEIGMTGALFYDVGDGRWCNFLASVIVYDRNKKQYLTWLSSFGHGHILAHSAFDGDPRFGINVVDVSIMDKAPDTSDISLFAGFEGDEDPDILYDAENNRWLMAICRIDPEQRQYVYTFFESDDPFARYKYIGKGYPGAETGGSFVKVDGELFFVCGNDFKSTSNYRIYSKDGMKNAKFDYPDGGFRGWGSVIPVRLGSRTRYFWLTFDRHNGSDYNWSYGNLYCFELGM